jgi:hypothetical protein
MSTAKPASKQPQLPVILYEEPSGKNERGISMPYIEVPKGGQMPPMLFIFEYKHTGETEPDDRGREVAIVDQIPHKYVDMEYLKDRLSPELNDQIRVALGMKPLQVAKEEGQKILDKVMFQVSIIKDEAEKEKDTKTQLIGKELEKRFNKENSQ